MRKQSLHFCHDPFIRDSVVVSRPIKVVIRPDHTVWVGQIDPWTFTISSGPQKWREEGSIYLFCELDKLKLIHEEIGTMLDKIKGEET